MSELDQDLIRCLLLLANRNPSRINPAMEEILQTIQQQMVSAGLGFTIKDIEYWDSIEFGPQLRVDLTFGRISLPDDLIGRTLKITVDDLLNVKGSRIQYDPVDDVIDGTATEVEPEPKQLGAGDDV